MDPLNIDLHLHSIASGHAFNTIDELTHFARINGYCIIGISDHGPQMEGAPHSGYFEMLSRLPKAAGNTQLLYGCEANILDQFGTLDISAPLLHDLDYVIAGLHRRTPYQGRTTAEHTRSIVSAIHSGYVDIISHPVSLNFMVDTKEVVRAAAQCHVILEANKTVLLEAVRRGCQDVIAATKALFSEAQAGGVPLLFGSDAHHISEMGLSEAERALIAEQYDFDVNGVVNCRPVDLLKLLRERKTIRGCANEVQNLCDRWREQ